MQDQLNAITEKRDQITERLKALEEREEKLSGLHCGALGEEYADTLSAAHGLAKSYSKLERHREALEWMQKTYDLYCKVYGENNSRTVEVLCDLAVCYGNAGDKEKEQELHRKYLAYWSATMDILTRRTHVSDAP
ncbi:MAG: tetratricopeptide repeat protein [Ruminococcaceae bacterium]|nr:tetratricopeptide repeat protein [Oscillospiraceae bacterium]